MDSDVLLGNADDVKDGSEARDEENAFQSRWQDADAAQLQPNNLPIPKIQRAWDRKPLSPFSRQRLRVGKVWKRPTSSLRRPYADNSAAEGARAAKRLKRRSPVGSAMQPVKKMCLNAGYGLGAHVLKWESSASPTRRIVTRSSAVEEDIIALPDEEEEQTVDSEEADVTVEILGEDGTVLKTVGVETGDAQEWEDESEGASEDEPTQEHFEMSSTTPTLEIHESEGQAQAGIEGPMTQEISPEFGAGTASPRSVIVGQGQTSEQDINSMVHGSQSPLHTSQGVSKSPQQGLLLPDGFVSPAKSMPTSKRKATSCKTFRRKTLPEQFAPTSLTVAQAEEPLTPAITRQDASSDEANVEAAAADRTEDFDEMSYVPVENSLEQHEEGWQNLETAGASGSAFDESQASAGSISDNEEEVPSTESTPQLLSAGSVRESLENRRSRVDLRLGRVQDIDASTTRLPSSPIPTIEGQHPRLPLRRSPRRKSCSPIIRSQILPSTDASHLVAFTPIRWQRSQVMVNSPLTQRDVVQRELSTPPFVRAASEPPEEVNQRLSRPRISDDTALLQAFLNRAAENKSSRRVSATLQESITNRRDSDTIRQALASPAKAMVLGDLDPNSPSPRKPAALLNSSEAVDEPTVDATSTIEPIERVEGTHSGKRTRRSGRTPKKLQPSDDVHSTAPNKIAIRSNADGVVLKKSEAQELAVMTRINTRKNKFGATLPTLRLETLKTQPSGSDEAVVVQTESSTIDNVERATSIKWAETLVKFHQGGEVSENSVTSDASSTTEDQAQVQIGSELTVATVAPLAAETPSKPTIRRLKPSRTAATPGKLPSAPSTSAAEERLEKTDSLTPAAPKAKTAVRAKKRSRIATPAKGLGDTSLLPPDLDPQPGSAAEKKQAPRKKPLASKLPGPTTTTTSLSQGKENLIASPPKKRPSTGLPAVKSFGPKLDFGKARLEPTLAAEAEVTLPALLSPAKKAVRKGAVFGGESSADNLAKREEAVPGLSSPAKKRTRRAAP